MILKQKFQFEAAHKLEWHPKYKKLHGHSYKLWISVWRKGDVIKEKDVVIGFEELKKIVEKEILSILDHSYLNDIIKNPTAENITGWICAKLFEPLNKKGLHIWEVELEETEGNSVILQGEMYFT